MKKLIHSFIFIALFACTISTTHVVAHDNFFERLIIEISQDNIELGAKAAELFIQSKIGLSLIDEHKNHLRSISPQDREECRSELLSNADTLIGKVLALLAHCTKAERLAVKEVIVLFQEIWNDKTNPGDYSVNYVANRIIDYINFLGFEDDTFFTKCSTIGHAMKTYTAFGWNKLCSLPTIIACNKIK